MGAGSSVWADGKSLATAPALPQASSAPFVSFPVSTAPITTQLIIQRLGFVESQIKTLSAHFHQVIKIKDVDLIREIGGSLEYSKPRRFNIKQTLPEPQRAVSDGEKIWIWRPSKNQVIEMKLKAWGRSQPFAKSLLDFGHYSRMIQSYQVKIARTSSLSGDLKGYQEIIVLLTPKKGEAHFSLRLKLNTRDFFPFESEFRQKGVFVYSRFSRIIYNIALPKSEFHFEAPRGAEVFDESLESR